MKTVIVIETGDYPVKLEQQSNGDFRVTYGVEVKSGLGYSVAAEEFGLCVFHALACAGKLETSE